MSASFSKHTFSRSIFRTVTCNKVIKERRCSCPFVFERGGEGCVSSFQGGGQTCEGGWAEQEAADVVSRAEQLRGEAAAIFFSLL